MDIVAEDEQGVAPSRIEILSNKPLELEQVHQDLGLEVQCRICVENLGRCVQLAESIAEVNHTFIRTKVRILKKLVQERKLRLAVWIVDCGIQGNDLSFLDRKANADLFSLLEHFFLAISIEEECIFRALCNLRGLALEAVRDESKVRVDEIARAQKIIEVGCDRLNQNFYELAKLQNAVKMSLAVEGRGPEAAVYAWTKNWSHIPSMDNQHSTSTDKSSLEASDKQCPTCSGWFPSGDLDTHQGICVATKHVHSDSRNTTAKPRLHEIETLTSQTNISGSSTRYTNEIFRDSNLKETTKETIRPTFAPENDPWRPIILSLDGGGIRGLSSLLLIREIMREIKKIEMGDDDGDHDDRDDSGSSQHLPLPCYYFDFMVGTGFGGLIAVMLGRLRMDIDDCVEALHELGLSTFRPRTLRLLRSISSNFQYSSFKFNAAVQKIVSTNCRRCNAKERPVCESPLHQLFRQPDYAERGTSKGFVNKTCKSSVVTLRKAGRNSDGERGAEVTYLFRTYDHRRRGGMGELNPKLLEESDLKIFEACIATSATPTWFPPVTIRGRRYLDGALADQNNPSRLAWYEAKEMAYQNPRALLSIGTGKQKVPDRRGSILNLIRAVRYQLTDTEGAHKDTERIASNNGCNYWRLNVPVSESNSSGHHIKGLETIKLDDCHKYDEIKERTLQYCETEVGKATIKSAALSLFESSQGRRANDLIRWKQFRDHPDPHSSSGNI